MAFPFSKIDMRCQQEKQCCHVALGSALDRKRQALKAAAVTAHPIQAAVASLIKARMNLRRTLHVKSSFLAPTPNRT